MLKPRRAFRQRLVGIMAKPFFHVPKTVLVGHELNAMKGAVIIQPEEVLSLPGGRLTPDTVMSGIGEGVLHVELKLIELELPKDLDQFLKGLPVGHLAPADIEHESTNLEARHILNIQLRDGANPQLILQLSDG